MGSHHSVDAKANASFGAAWFEVDIRGAALESIEKNESSLVAHFSIFLARVLPRVDIEHLLAHLLLCCGLIQRAPCNLFLIAAGPASAVGNLDQLFELIGRNAFSQ